jgi:CubicO group peptidase (beta-lactamase class C family)
MYDGTLKGRILRRLEFPSPRHEEPPTSKEKTMKRLGFIVISLVLATLVAGFTPANDIVACDLQGCISEAQLLQNISDTLKGKVVGFAAIVGGSFVASDGQARTSTDRPTVAMDPTIPGDIASVSKTLTTVAVLQLLAKNGLTIDSKISPFLYPDWSQGQNIDQITFKQLLTHHSGLRTDCGGSKTTYAILKGLVAQGVQSSDMNKPSYNNCNFAIFREMLPALSGQPVNNIPDGAPRAQKSAAMYIAYMNQHVFAPVGVATRACKPPGGSNVVLSYPFPAGSAHGINWGDWTLACGAGGWLLSAHDIFQVVNSIASNTTLLTDAQRKQMIADCLGWDCAVRRDCPTPYVCKNGDLGSGKVSVWTYAGIFKCNVPVVVYVNSPLPAPYQPGEDIIGIVMNAYKAAAVSGTAKACT